MKEETLEETALKLYPIDFSLEYDENKLDRNIWLKGANWQLNNQDEFAMSFGRWMASGVEFIDDTEQGRIYDYKHKRYTTEQLLEIFKKEHNL